MIKVGCCGWGFYRGGLSAYQKKFSTVEIQQSFYRLPALKTAERWRSEALEGFEFTLKAWQAITHLSTSPTWRRSNLKPEDLARRQYGWLRPTQDNFNAWNQIMEVANVLDIKVCVIQCPPNFKCTGKNIENMRKFLSSVERGDLVLAWEPRGDWKEHPEKIEELCEELELVHVVDLMRGEPLSNHWVAYIRLHGLNPREHDYNYEYSTSELERLADRVRELEKNHREVYVMFNNFQMYKNAAQLRRILDV